MRRIRLAYGNALRIVPTEAAVAPAPAAAMTLRVTLVVLFFTYWCVDIVSPALPAIRDSLAISATGAGLVFSLFFAGRLVTNLPAACLVERAGPRLTAAIGSLVLLAGSLFAAASTSLETLLPARGIQGAGVAILATAGLLSVLRARPGGGAAMTAFNVSSGVGSSAGLLAGGFLATAFGWRSVFSLVSLIAVILLVSIQIARSQPAMARPTLPDEPGFASANGTSGKAQAAAVAANLLVFVNYAIWVFALPLLGAVKFGLTPEQVGLLLLFVNVVHLGSAVPFGRIIRLGGAPRALAIGFGLAGIGVVLTPLAPTVPWLAIPMALYAMGQVAGNSAAGDLILRLGGGGGRAVGAVRLSSDIGMVVGPAAAGVLADAAGVDAPFYALGLLSLAVAAVAVAARLRAAKHRGGPR